jgi:hypothetical protein
MSKQFEHMQKLAFGKVLIKESMINKKFTTEALKAHIREIVLDEAKKKKEKPEDVAPQEDVDIDTESSEETPMDVTPPEASTAGEDIDPTVKSINYSLQTALAQAKKLGDTKLVTQIGNTLTMLLRDNIIGQQNVSENLNEDDIFNDTYTVSDEAYERMNNLVSESDYDNFISSATKIMNDLTDDGFEVKDVFYYLYTRLTAEV